MVEEFILSINRVCRNEAIGGHITLPGGEYFLSIKKRPKHKVVVVVYAYGDVSNSKALINRS